MIHREYTMQEAMSVAMRSLHIERELSIKLEALRQQQQNLIAQLQACKEARLALELSD